MATPVAIALGSNLGDRRAHLEWALSALEPSILTSVRASAFVDTAPHDVPDAQPHYLNAVVVGTTTLAPRAVVDGLLDLERARGRVRLTPKAARTLDLDLILYGDLVVTEQGLIVPHPRFRERAFVLAPLATLVPGWRDPVTGLTVRALAGRLTHEGPAGQ